MPENKKIGGWLILLGIQLLSILIFYSNSLIGHIRVKNQYSSIMSNSKFDSIKSYFQIEAIIYGLLLIGTVYILVLFFNKRSTFRSIYALYMTLTILGFGALSIIAGNIEYLPKFRAEEFRIYVLSNVVWFAIWISYLYKSPRAKSTFNN